jgi:cellulose synthase/poly-beta-1,6-N-acetylglucosamine synthase-like glycosyltransferase
MKTFSVIVIGKNEEAHLADSLRSVLAATAELSDNPEESEIVYVDSASTDRSIEIARSFGVRVLSLRPDWIHTPAAGRYIGFHHTTGEYLMFVDGDTVIDRKWLSRALACFIEPQVAGVAGYLNDLDEHGQEIPYVGERGVEMKELPRLRGIAAYRRAAFEQVGPFNPYLRSEEEAELALRLRKAQWKLLHLPLPMGCHQRGIAPLKAMWRAWRLGRATGVGLAWRYACRNELGTQFCFENLRHTMIFAALCLALSPGLILWEEHYTQTAVLFLYPLLALMLAIAVKKRDLTGPLNYLVTHATILTGLLSGLFITRLPDPAGYPTDALEATAPQPETVTASTPDFFAPGVTPAHFANAVEP